MITIEEQIEIIDKMADKYRKETDIRKRWEMHENTLHYLTIVYNDPERRLEMILEFYKRRE